MTYVIRYSTKIDMKRFMKLPKSDRERIKNAIELKLTTRPEVYGKPLRQSFEGCRSLRVGDYRVIYRISGTIINILLFGHRSTVYTYGHDIL